MKTSKFTEEQMAFALWQPEGVTKVAEVCRKGNQRGDFFTIERMKYEGTGISELRPLKRRGEDYSYTTKNYLVV